MADTVGLPTQLYGFGNPNPSIRRLANSLVIEWPKIFGYPLRSSLESTTNLVQGGGWRTVTSGVVESNFFGSYVVPLGSNSVPTYYRLLSTSP